MLEINALLNGKSLCQKFPLKPYCSQLQRALPSTSSWSPTQSFNSEVQMIIFEDLAEYLGSKKSCHLSLRRASKPFR